MADGGSILLGGVWRWPTRHGRTTVLRRALSRDRKARADEIRPTRRIYEPAQGIRHRTCQWIADEPAGASTEFCGQPVASGTSWCPCHLARAFTYRDG
jgi:hypothetical protein